MVFKKYLGPKLEIHRSISNELPYSDLGYPFSVRGTLVLISFILLVMMIVVSSMVVFV